MMLYYLFILSGLICDSYSKKDDPASVRDESEKCYAHKWIDELPYYTLDNLSRRQKGALQKIEGQSHVPCSVLAKVHRDFYGSKHFFEKQIYITKTKDDSLRDSEDDDIDDTEEPEPNNKVEAEPPHNPTLSAVVERKESPVKSNETLQSGNITVMNLNISEKLKPGKYFCINVCLSEERVVSSKIMYYFFGFNRKVIDETGHKEKDDILNINTKNKEIPKILSDKTVKAQNEKEKDTTISSKSTVQAKILKTSDAKENYKEKKESIRLKRLKRLHRLFLNSSPVASSKKIQHRRKTIKTTSEDENSITQPSLEDLIRLFSSAARHGDFSGKLSNLESSMHNLEKRLLQDQLGRSEESVQQNKLESSIHRLETELVKLSTTVSKLRDENDVLRDMNVRSNQQKKKIDYLALPEAIKSNEVLSRRMTSQALLLTKELQNQGKKISRLTGTVNILRRENQRFAQQLSHQKKSMEDLRTQFEVLLTTRSRPPVKGKELKPTGSRNSHDLQLNQFVDIPPTISLARQQRKQMLFYQICRLLRMAGVRVCCCKSDRDEPALPVVRVKPAKHKSPTSKTADNTHLDDIRNKSDAVAQKSQKDESKKEDKAPADTKMKTGIIKENVDRTIEQEKSHEIKVADTTISKETNSESSKQSTQKPDPQETRRKDVHEKSPFLYWNPKHDQPKDCYDYLLEGKKMNRVMRLTPVGKPDLPFKAFCDIKGGGWTLIMRRTTAKLNFYQDWENYSRGFGDPYFDHWLGNNALHLLTNQNSYQLRIELTDWSGETRHADYSTFRVDSSDNGYRLNVSGYQGNAGDAMSAHNGHQFSTLDVDNDKAVTKFGGSCAKRFKGAWWYYSCYKSNLTGKYYDGGKIPPKHFDGIIWKPWTGTSYSLKKVLMKIKPHELKQ